jgi:amidohydrolase
MRNIPEPLLADVVARVTALRHDLHAHPELSGNEVRTARVVSEMLAAAGITHRCAVGGGNGIVADIDGTAGAGPRWAFRGDMDALPIQEESDVPYRSTVPGVMHACGHDGHTANLMGTALLLQSMRDRLQGSVRLLFQPAEETVSGADDLIAGGALDGVDRIVMLHGWPDLPAGDIGLRYGPAMASSDTFRVVIHGKGGHAAYPHKTVDPVWIGAQLVTALQGVVAREVSPTDPVVVSVTTFHAGTARNIIAEHAEITGTVRTLSHGVRSGLPTRLKEIVEGICATHRATCTFEWTSGTPPVVNDTPTVRRISASAERVVGTGRIHEIPDPTMGAEDFSLYLDKVPGAMLRIGTGCPHLLHTPGYDYGDAPLPIGIALFADLALTITDDN